MVTQSTIELHYDSKGKLKSVEFKDTYVGTIPYTQVVSTALAM